ncbi:MAG: hypothetical protein GQ576_07090 [Methanococcoides sp.]|nr:hypothetical protein [Methanococcoides sp.]
MRTEPFVPIRFRPVPIESKHIYNPDELLELKDLRKAIAKTLWFLNIKEHKVIIGVYYTEESFAAIGKSLGITGSRVCQIHARALRKIRTQMYLHGSFEEMLSIYRKTQ